MGGRQICKGGYVWNGWGWTSDVIVDCFTKKLNGQGVFNSDGKQSEGPYAGKSKGTGMVKFSDGALFLVIYGLLPSETSSNNFPELWKKYGGNQLGNIKVAPVRKAPTPLQTSVAMLD